MVRGEGGNICVKNMRGPRPCSKKIQIAAGIFINREMILRYPRAEALVDSDGKFAAKLKLHLHYDVCFTSRVGI
jgi:hypothetical protein